jgi:hypothetical protein
MRILKHRDPDITSDRKRVIRSYAVPTFRSFTPFGRSTFGLGLIFNKLLQVDKRI